jgi:sugar O-acyltransferase (sialic acid O-acetyltransferase NeuD family)
MTESTIPVVILGAGGFAREVLDVFDAANAAKASFDVLGYIVDTEYVESGKVINGKPILGDYEWLRGKPAIKCICGVGAPEVRFRMINRVHEIGAGFCSIIHPGAIMSSWNTIGEGSVITAGCILTNQIRIGNHVHVNLDCTIGHDAVLQDFVTLAPGVHVSGKVNIEEGSYIGTGVNIIEGKRIGAWSVVGAGSTVIRDIPENATAVGVPAQVIKVRESGWHLSG